MDPLVRLELLGPPRITVGGEPIEVDTRKAIALLAYLALGGVDRSRDALAGLLWPDYDQAHARAALRRTLSTLNRALGGVGLRVTRATLGVDRAVMWLDVEEFRALASGCAGHRGDPARGCAACRDRLARAAALYRDDLLAGFSVRDAPDFEEWSFFESESLRRELVAVLDRLAAALRYAGEPESALEHAHRWAQLEPLHEQAHRLLMQLYMDLGRRAEALRRYRECVAILDRELGVAPLDETTELYRAIVEGRYRARPPAAAARPRRAPATAPPLVGRSAELEALEALYREIGPDGCFIGVEGEAGVGKTRLVEEFVAARAGAGAVVASARSHEDEAGVALGAITEALRAALARVGEPPAGLPEEVLREAARALPELTDGALAELPALDAPGALARFYGALAQLLTALLRGPVPGVLVFDDVHWIDDSSLDVVRYLVRRLDANPLCVVATWRREEPAAYAHLRRLVGDARRAGLGGVVSLERLSESDVRALAGSVLPDIEDPALVERLWRETEGLPFFVVEYLRALAERGTSSWSLPASVRDVLMGRVAAASDSERQLLSAAAIVGRSFGFDLLRAVSGRGEEETVRGVEELVRRGLFVVANAPGSEPSYDFSHARLRDLVLEDSDPARRRLLHRRAARALMRPGRAGRDEAAGIVAQHLELAGEAAAAAEYHELAGDRARSLFANTEALEHYRRALALGTAHPGRIHEAIGDLFTLLGDYAQALASFEVAAAHEPPERLPAIEHKIAGVHIRRGEWEAAEGRLHAALEGGATGGRRARVEADRSLVAHRCGRAEQARALARAARAEATAVGDTAARAQALNILGILANADGDSGGAREHLTLSLGLAESLGDAGARAAALNNLSLTALREGRVDDAEALAQQALALCTARGDRHREAAVRNNLADILHARGSTEESMAQLKRAVAIFAEIGEPDEPRPEVWKLFEW